jgi:hypothetical protein
MCRREEHKKYQYDFDVCNASEYQKSYCITIIIVPTQCLLLPLRTH